MALTDIKVRTAKPTDKQYKLTDGNSIHFSRPWILASVVQLWREAKYAGFRCIPPINTKWDNTMAWSAMSGCEQYKYDD